MTTRRPSSTLSLVTRGAVASVALATLTAWREIAGTQDTWRCGLLKKYVVPSDVAGDTCYTYASKHLHAKQYSQD